MKTLAITIAACLTVCSVATADIMPTALQIGTQGDFVASPGGLTLANDGAWFTFAIAVTTSIDVDIDRTVADPDLGASLYAGDVTGVDFGTNLIADVFSSSFGPLGFVERRDDDEDDAFGGPAGDPRFGTLLGPGEYSILVYSFNGSSGTFSIDSNVEGTAAIPEPSVALVWIGAGCCVSLRRRRR